MIKKVSSAVGIAVALGARSMAADAAPPKLRLVPQIAHLGALSGGAFSSDGQMILTTSRADGMTVLWHVPTGTVLRRFWGFADPHRSWSRDGRTLVTAAGRIAFVWNTATGELVHRLEGHEYDLDYAMLSPDESRILTASKGVSGDGTVAIWDRVTGRRMTVFQAPWHTWSLSWGPSGREVWTAGIDATAGFDRNKTLFVWDARKGRLRRVLRTEEVSDYDPVPSPDAARFVLPPETYGDPTMTVFHARTKKALRTLTMPKRALGLGTPAVAWFPKGRRLVASAGGREPAVFDTRSGRLLFTLRAGHSDDILDLAVSPDGKLILTGSKDKTATLWNARTGAIVARLGRLILTGGTSAVLRSKGHGGPVNHVAFSPDGRFALTAGGDARAIVWACEGGEFVRSFSTAGVGAVAVTMAKNTLVAGAWQGATRWALDRGGRASHLLGHSGWIDAVSVDEAATLLATASGSKVHVWDLASDRRIAELTAGEDDERARHIVLSDDGRLVATQHGTVVTVAEARGGRPLRRMESVDREKAGVMGRELPPSGILAFTPRGDRLLYVVDDYALAVVDPRSGQMHAKLAGHHAPVSSVDFSADNRYVLTGSTDSTALLFDLASGRPLQRYDGHEEPLAAARFAGDRVVTASADGAITVFDRTTARSTRRIEAHRDPINALAVFGDGRRAVTGADDSTATIWDLRSGRRLHRLTGHTGPITGLFISDDDRRVVSVSWDGSLKLWNARTGREVASMLSFDNRTWLVAAPDGRFDTEDLGVLDGAAWVRYFEPYRPLDLTTFAREYFTPGLLRSLWNEDRLAPIPDLLDLNVLTPSLSLEAWFDDSGANIVAQVCTRTEEVATRHGPRVLASGAKSLQIFVDDKLVYHEPEVGHGCPASVPILEGVSVPRGTRRVRIAGHVFNADGVKSETVRVAGANPFAERRPERRAYLVHVGVDDYADRGLSPLQWAGSDAKLMSRALAEVPDHEVVTVVLANGGQAPATRRNLQSVLEALSGSAEPPPWAPGLKRSTPDDLVVMTFSGHGYAPEGGAFHLMLSDIGRTDAQGIEGALPFAVSEHALVDWLLPIRAREMALIVDACQSAASVQGEGFKPGPLASKGFGQLAYDKGMLVLAASQSDAVAFESEALRHGLLTWTLIKEGLEKGLAESDDQPGISLQEWLRFAEKRVPSLTGRIAKGQKVAGARAVTCAGRECRGVTRVGRPPVQRPRLFAFKGAGRTVIKASQ